MSDTDVSEGVAAGTAGIIDNMVPGAHSSSREHDRREVWGALTVAKARQ